MSNPQLILQALQQTIMGSSTEAVKAAQALLKTYEENPTFVQDIGMILEEIKVDSAIQKAAAVYLNKHATNVFKTKNQQLINITAQKILKLLTSYKIHIKHKVHITKALEYMISADKAKIIRTAFEPNLTALLVQTQKQTDDQINFEYLVFLGQALMNNPGFTQEVMKFIQKSFTPFVKLAVRVENLLKQIFEVQNGQLLLKLLFLSKEYFYLLKVYLKRFVLVDIESNKLMYVPELETLVSCAIELNLPQNLLSHSVFYISQVASPYAKLMNEMKCNCISFLTIFIRTLLGVVRQPKLLQINSLFKKSAAYLQNLINASQQLMKNHPYYKIKDLSVLSTLDQVYVFFITSLRTNCFYHVFVQYKEKMIEDLIFRALLLTPNDYENYYENPEQFINSLIHIIERDVKVKLRREDEKQDDQIQCFATLRTYAAEFLSTFCKYQDGTLTEIMKYAKMIIDRNINSQFSPSLMLLVMTILRQVCKQRKDLHSLINEVVTSMLQGIQIPKKTTEQPQSKLAQNKQLDVQYSLGLLLLSKTFNYVLLVNPKIIDMSFKVCHKILTDPKVEQAPKLLAINIIEVINHLEEGEPYSPDVLKTFNSLLKVNETPSHHLLQAYYSLIKYNDVILKKLCYNELVEMINTIALLIHQEVQKLQNSQQKQQITINKLWNVIRQVGENSQFIPLMIEPIENAIMPLLPYVDSNIEVDFQEDILMLMSAFIGKSHQVTQNQLKMFEIIPKIFYKQYKAVFGHSYQTMQTFIYYGKQILKTSPAAIKSIIHMGLTSISSRVYNGRTISESDNCEGALLLQSLIAAVGLSIEIKDYEEIVQTIRKRLSDKIMFNLLRANLVALLALVMIHSCDNFSNQVNDIILSSILNDISCFQNVKYAPKILIVALSKLLSKFHLEFVTRRYTQILDTIITLLQMIAMKKDKLFEEDDEDEERDYQNSLIQTINDIMKIDEFHDFRNQIKALKEQNIQLLQRTVGELPQSKKDFLKNILAVERVSNEPRKIFTIKRNK